MAVPQEKRYTFGDILNGGESERAELIDGQICMTAPPTRAHQRAVAALTAQFFDFLQDRPCEVYPAPFVVRLSVSKTVSVYTLESGRYGAGQVYAAGAAAPVGILGGLAVDTSKLFPA